MSNIVKKVSKLSLFLVGLAVVFGVVSCDCKKDDKVKGADTIQQDQEKTFKVKFKADADEDAVLLAPGFEQDNKTMKDLGITGAIKKDDTKSFKLKAKTDAAEGKVVIKVTKSATDKTEVAEFELTVEKK